MIDDEGRQPHRSPSSNTTCWSLVAEEDVGEHGLGLERCLQNRQTLYRPRRTSLMQRTFKNGRAIENR
jgi:hypothetical protein